MRIRLAIISPLLVLLVAACTSSANETPIATSTVFAPIPSPTPTAITSSSFATATSLPMATVVPATETPVPTATSSLRDRLKQLPTPIPTPSTAARAAAYAEVFGVDIDEAIRRVEVIAESEPVVERVEMLAGFDFLDAYVFHEPELRLLIRMRTEPTGFLESVIVNNFPVPVEVSTDVLMTGEEMQARLEPVRGDLINRFADLLGIGTDIRTGEVALDVFFDPFVFASLHERLVARLKLEKAALDLWAEIGVPVRLDFSRGRGFDFQNGS